MLQGSTEEGTGRDATEGNKILRLVQFIYTDPNFCPFSKNLIGYEDILVDIHL